MIYKYFGRVANVVHVALEELYISFTSHDEKLRHEIEKEGEKMLATLEIARTIKASCASEEESFVPSEKKMKTNGPCPRSQIKRDADVNKHSDRGKT